MKIYQIAGKQYAASGDDLYEKVPEFSAVSEPDERSEEQSTSTYAVRRKAKPKKQVREYVPKKGYKRGTCGRCGEEGHSAWHCPDRPETKGAKKQKEKEAESD
jgi:hypothetical protein